MLLCLLLAGCGGGAEDTQSVSATPTATPAAASTPIAPIPTPTALPAPETAGEAELSVMFINVGYGDAALIKTNGKTYMVDTGAKDAFVSLNRALSMLGVDRLDGLFLTHTHSDHVGGAKALALRCDIGMLYSAQISKYKDNGKNVIGELAADLMLTHQKLSAGDTVYIADGAYFEVLGPLVYNSDDDNDNSLVLKLHAAGITVLLTGDMQFAEEDTLLAAGVDLAADVLKVGNHGNPDATSQEFAQAVGAGLAVISTSTAQDDDTPNERVIAALDGVQIEVTQNYACGVLLMANGGEIELADPKAPEAAADIAIRDINKDAQTITLANNGGGADLSNFFIFSARGGEVFVFPRGAYLAAGDTLTVACRNGFGDYVWDVMKVWSGKAGELGILYDAYGNELSRLA
jgi:competence protein ComEC